MEIKYTEDDSPIPATKLAEIGNGELFRQLNASPGDTVWMRTHNASKDLHRAKEVRTVSLKAGSVSYKAPSMEVVRVKGHLQITDWGEG